MLAYEDFIKLELNPRMKVCVVSHNDLDGAGAVVIAKNYFHDCKYFCVSNANVNKVVEQVLTDTEFDDRELIFITDCSVDDKDLLTQIDMINKKTDGQIFLFDHHKTALSLNDYDWAHVTQRDGVSGTKLFWTFMEQYIAEELPTPHFIVLNELAEAISSYDTWKWIERNETQSKELAELYGHTGINYFIAKYVGAGLDKITLPNLLSTQDKALLEDKEILQKYVIVPAIKRSAVVTNFNFATFDENGRVKNLTSKKIKVVTISSGIGNLAEELYEPEVDIIFFLYHDAISMRSRTDDIDLGQFAKRFGGGGHTKAAGFPITCESVDMFLDFIKAKFKMLQEKER